MTDVQDPAAEGPRDSSGKEAVNGFSGSTTRGDRNLMTRLWARFAGDPTYIATVVAFLLSLFIVSANLFPNLSEINSWDEAVYVNSGRLLLEGQWPVFASNPLVAMFYALTSLPYLDSTFWLIKSTSFARVLLYGFLWVGSYSVARQLSNLAHPLVTVGLLFVSIIPVSILVFPSDPLFVGFAALSLAYGLTFLKDNSIKSLALSSLFVGFAALARNDGLVLGAVLAIAAALFATPPLSRRRAAAVAAGPFLIIVFGYVLFYGFRSGQFELGTIERTYDNFEAGHQSIYAGEGQINPVLEAKEEARRVFGTPQENRYSVWRAIAKDPTVYLRRVLAAAKSLPSQVLSAYGVRMAVPILLFAARGIWELIRRRQVRPLSLMLLWLAPVLTGFVITLFRTGHLRFSFFVVFSFAAIGIISSLRNLGEQREQLVWGIAIAAIAIYGLVDSKPAVVYGMIVILAAFMFSLIVSRRWPVLSRSLAAPALLFLAAGLLLHGDFPGPKARMLGEAPDERAVQFLFENFEAGTPVAAGSPGPVYAAKMSYMGLTSLDVPKTDTPQQFLEWMSNQGIEAVYVDATLSSGNPYLWDQISALTGDGLKQIFIADEGDIQVLSLKD